MKTLFLAFSLATISPAAFADLGCSTESATLEVTEKNNQPAFAKFTGKDFSDFYQKSFGLKISHLESVIDPDTNQPVTNPTENGLNFLSYAPKSGTDAVWGIWLSIGQARKTARISVVDMEGKAFNYDVTCDN